MSDSSLRVVHVCEPIASAAAVHVEQLVRHLHGVSTLACPSDSVLNYRLADTGVEIVNIEMKRGLHPVGDLRAGRSLAHLVHRRSFDIAHLHSFKAGLIGRVSAKIFHIPTVFTPHCFSFLSQRGRPALFKALVALERAFGHVTDRLVCVSQEELQIAVQLRIVPAARATYIPNFVDLARWNPRRTNLALKEKLGIPEAHQVVGTVSRYFPQKAPLDFLRMANIVASAKRDVSFLFIGEDGPLRREVHAYAREHRLSEKVTFHCWTDHVPDLVSLMDVFVLNWLWEGLPLTILEAMAMKKPIVATAACCQDGALEVHCRDGTATHPDGRVL